MQMLFKKFGDDMSGAISVDWVVLSAALVGFIAAAMIAIQAATISLADRTSLGISETLTDIQAQTGLSGSGG